VRVDEELLQQCAQGGWTDGATCAAVWLVGSTAFVANVGDARAVLARADATVSCGCSACGTGNGAPGACAPGTCLLLTHVCARARDAAKCAARPQAPAAAAKDSAPLKAVVLTKDHLAMHTEERARIERAGGRVSADGRLSGRIQVSRSFGDAQFKGAGASAVPDVRAFSAGSRERFLLVACDGFWGVMDPQGAVDLAAAQLAQGKEPKAVTNRFEVCGSRVVSHGAGVWPQCRGRTRGMGLHQPNMPPHGPRRPTRTLPLDRRHAGCCTRP
jgi:integrin-linked kinase-associated serine/threonine phosphatase 2C